MPSKTLGIFQSIAATVNKLFREDIDKDDEEGLCQRAAQEPWHLLTVRTRHLAQLADALDNATVRGVPMFYPSTAQLELVMSSRSGGKYRAKDELTKKAVYTRLRKIALKGLRASRIAYKLAWDKEKTVIQNIPANLPSLEDADEEDEDMETPPHHHRGKSIGGVVSRWWPPTWIYFE